MNNTDETEQRRLADGIRKSDQRAFDELFRAMYPRLVRFAFKITRDWNASCDITQDIFVMLWQQRNNIDPDRSIHSWLYRSVRNRSYNYQRDRRNIADPEMADALTDESYPADVLVNEDRQEALLKRKFREWIHALPLRQRETFELSRFEGLCHQEIAAVMDVSVKTVNNHLTAALKQLRMRYKAYRQASQDQ